MYLCLWGLLAVADVVMCRLELSRIAEKSCLCSQTLNINWSYWNFERFVLATNLILWSSVTVTFQKFKKIAASLMDSLQICISQLSRIHPQGRLGRGIIHVFMKKWATCHNPMPTIILASLATKWSCLMSKCIFLQLRLYLYFWAINTQCITW